MALLEIRILIELPRRAEALLSGAASAELLRQEAEHIVADLEGYEERHGCQSSVTATLIGQRLPPSLPEGSSVTAFSYLGRDIGSGGIAERY